MSRRAPLSDAQVEAAKAEWLKRGNKVQQLRLGKSCRRPLTYAGFDTGEIALIEVDLLRPKAT